MKKPQNFEELLTYYRTFLAERNWGKADPRFLAISISLEANELLEHFQWSDTPIGNTQELSYELVDILHYLMQFADVYNIDLVATSYKKLQQSAKKYPAEKFADKSPEEQRTIWLNAKQQHDKKESL